MALQKQPIDIPFAQGLDQKIDPYRLPIGKFQTLTNSIFDKGGVLQKRNGYGYLATLPNLQSSYLTTLNGNLTAIGPTISAYNEGNKSWVAKGDITPLQIDTLPLIRNNYNQIQSDTAIAANGLVCTAYSENQGASTIIKYAIADSVTGQNIVAPTALSVVTSGSNPKVFLVDNNFVIVYVNTNGGTNSLEYITISSVNPTVSTTPQVVSANTLTGLIAWDGIVANNTLYIAFNTLTGGQSLVVASLPLQRLVTGLTAGSEVTYATYKATIVSVTADMYVPSTPIIYVSFYRSDTSVGYTLVTDADLNPITSPTSIISSGAFVNLASVAVNGVCTIFGEVTNTYASPINAFASNYIDSVTFTQAGSVGTPFVSIRSVGLASKAFIVNNQIYFLAAFSSTYQPTYFLINGSLSTAAAPAIVGKVAYENGGGYVTHTLPNVTISNSTAYISYLRKDLVQALATTDNSQQTTTGGIYTQTGVNLATFTFTSDTICTAEIGNDLHLSGGFLGLYDGYLPVEHNFFVWPDNVGLAASGSGGSMTAQQYFYQALYEWSDNQGNIYRSAPSIPVTTTTSGSTSSVVLTIPTLRLTMKTNNPVKIVIYRWSTANQVYYQLTSITSPLLNSTTTDAVTYTDTVADSSIIGNSIIYTAGGVIEDINASASNIMTLFDTRLWLVDAEDKNLLWFSKQVIESTPVEMSDLLTVYVAPNAGTAASTGPITGLAPMDDKLVIFKKDAIYYINGAGPDNTGSNNQYSQPIFIAGTVGCTNQRSIVLTPMGLMFQSDKGIWLLGRDLQTSYIGSPVAGFNTSIVNSSNNIPETNQVRFTLNTGETLVYDTYYQQWGTFKGVPAASSCIYLGLHSYINIYGEAYTETPGLYLDGSTPVLLNFTTGWINVAGLHGFERAYYFYLLGTYLSPHKLQLQIAYNYNGSPVQSLIISPDNFSASTPSPYGATPAPFGSPTNLEQWRIFLDRQKCQSFQITMNELFDPSLGTVAGAGVALSGLNLVVSAKKGYKPLKAAHSAGGNS